MVRATDTARRRYVRAYLNADVTDKLHYDLVVNTASRRLECVARIICAAVVHLGLQYRGQTMPPRPAENNDAGWTSYAPLSGKAHRTRQRSAIETIPVAMTKAK